MELRYPSITAQDTPGQIGQLKSYLHQLVEQLNIAVENVSSGSNVISYQNGGSGSPMQSDYAESPMSTFNSIKALIIKSADIVNAYYQQINRRLEGVYVAQSDFGEYKEITNQNIEANSQGIKQVFENQQSITGQVESLIDAQAWTKTGLLEYDSQGAPVYGFEVGQKTVIDGTEVFNRYARFVSGGIYFYLPSSETPVAWMSSNKLYILNAEITRSVKLGQSYLLDLSNGIAFKPTGGAGNGG